MTKPHDENDPKTVHPAVWTIYAIIATAVIFLAVVGRNDFIEIIQAFILALTLFAVIWTTFETRSMQKAASKQVEVAVRQTNMTILPVLIADIEYVRTTPTVRGHTKLNLENIGNGTAFNIRIDSLKIDLGFEAPGLLRDPHLVFTRIASLEKGDEVVVECRSLSALTERPEDDLSSVMEWLRHLRPERATANYTMRIRFTDIIGNKYIQDVHLGKDGYWPGIVKADES